MTNINSLIKENLIKLKETKVIKEDFIKERFKKLVENKTIKTKSQKNKISNDILFEVYKMREEKIDDKVINEQFKDFILGSGARGWWETIQENMIGKLLESLGLDKTSWISDIIKVSVSNIKLSEVTKLMDCKYLSGLISKSVVETIVLRLQRSAGVESGFTNSLRNIIIDSVSKSDIGRQIENTISGFICPVVTKIGGKFSEAFGDK